MLRVNSHTSLADLFRAICTKIDNELFSLRRVRNDPPKWSLDLIDKTFCSVVKLNGEYLSAYAANELKAQMGFSFGLKESAVDFEEVVRLRGDGDSSLYPTRSIREESRLGSVVVLIQKVEVDKVRAAFRVYDKSKPTVAEFVILFKDKSYFCTCVLLQNKGLVCSHIFWMMQEDARFGYHLRLIPRRWFKEEYQQDRVTDNKIRKQLFVFATPSRVQGLAKENSSNNAAPFDSYMDTLQQIYPPQPVISARQQQISIKKRFAKAM
ncbi:hypothetical protein BGX28_001573, partial [Mortierella sp. GBA30]